MKLFICSVLSFLFLLSACSGNESAKKKNEEARDALRNEMKDSLALFEKKLDSLQQSIPLMIQQTDEMLREFDRVENPREVEGYYILRSERKNYPLENTGLTARITNSETLELIAALQGGAFDQIKVTDNSGSAQSDAVPNDQGLNYRIGNFTTVAFTGNKADSVALLIANAKGNVTLTFLNRGTGVSKTLTGQQQKVIAETFRLYSKRREINRAEKEIPLLARKCELLRERLSAESEQTGTPQR